MKGGAKAEGGTQKGGEVLLRHRGGASFDNRQTTNTQQQTQRCSSKVEPALNTTRGTAHPQPTNHLFLLAAAAASCATPPTETLSRLSNGTCVLSMMITGMHLHAERGGVGGEGVRRLPHGGTGAAAARAQADGPGC